MAVTTTATAAMNLGFLTILHEPSGYLGGYLVTNQWGRPLEFRLSTAVQPNRVQQILYGGTLQPYICADLIGKTLIDKTGIPVQLVLTDFESVLDLRNRLDAPVLWLAPPNDPVAAAYADKDCCIRPPGAGNWVGCCHARYPGDAPILRDMLEACATLDFAEPFTRIREAISEARKMGVTGRG